MRTTRMVIPPLPTGPDTVLDMPLDGPMTTTQVQDRSQNANHGTIGSGNTFVYPGLDFDGTDDANVTPAAQDLGDPQTFSCWFKPDGVAGADCLFLLEGVADEIFVGTSTLSVANLTNTPTFYVDGVASTTVVAGKWQMMTTTLDGAEPASAVVIGDAVGVTQCDGVISDVFISNKELSAAEVLNRFNITSHKYGV